MDDSATRPSVATARIVSVCAPLLSLVVSHFPVSPLNTYARIFSVQRSCPSVRNSTRVIVASMGCASQRTCPLTVSPSLGIVAETWNPEVPAGGGEGGGGGEAD